MKWYHKWLNLFHEWNAKRPSKRKSGYSYTRYLTREEVWHQNMQSSPTNEVKYKVQKAFKMVVKYDKKENLFWEVNEKGKLSRIKSDTGIRRPMIGFCCDKCGIAGEFNLFEVPGKGAYCYPDAYKELV